MITKSQPDEIQSFLADSSHVRGGFAERVVFPETAEDVAEVLRAATRTQTPVTISGAGTGTVAGRVPFGGVVVATDKLNRITQIVHDHGGGGHAVAESGVILGDFQRAVESEGLLYPPDPTERSCFLGGNIATNASGARTFKYGPTRNYVERLQIALATGEVINLRRGELHADRNSLIRIPLSSGEFIEAELKLLPKPEGLLSGVVFFEYEPDLLAFVGDARERSLATRDSSPTVREGVDIDARALEYFDVESLK